MPIEKNTFATSAFIAAPTDKVYEYLCDLKNLNEWTLYSRMKEKVDRDTWLGSASGFQHDLYYHIKRLNHSVFPAIEWHCGPEYKRYQQVYPVMLFPSHYVDPAGSQNGTYLHWVSFSDPKRRRPMFMEGILTVHNSEVRSLKGHLERRAGSKEAVYGNWRIEPDTIFIDAPVEHGLKFLGNIQTMDEWCHLLKATGLHSENQGKFEDEYGREVEVSLANTACGDWYTVEQDHYYPDYGRHERCVNMLIPCDHAFQNPRARGFILNRITFWHNTERPRIGKLLPEDYGAESINIKRMLEAQAGNIESFERGMSYLPDAD